MVDSNVKKYDSWHVISTAEGRQHLACKLVLRSKFLLPQPRHTNNVVRQPDYRYTSFRQPARTCVHCNGYKVLENNTLSKHPSDLKLGN
jgi:hypothetical protein